MGRSVVGATPSVVEPSRSEGRPLTMFQAFREDKMKALPPKGDK